jgi:hypothetical protein
MIRYSTQPSSDAKAITDSPTAPISTSTPVLEKQLALDLDLDADDANDN